MTFRRNMGACGAAGKACLDHAPDCAGMPAKPSADIRLIRKRLLFAVLFSGMTTSGLLGQSQHSSPPPPPHVSSQGSHPLSASHSSAGHQTNSQNHAPGQEHLGEWMKKNQGLTPDQQIEKLQRERGFNQLTPQQQQGVTNRLRQLDQMPPQQRQRVLERVENMEHLSPQQQEQVRASARTLGQMPADRQQAVKDAIRNLRNVPPGLRESELNSKYGSQLTPQERGIVGNLLSVESYHPPPPPPR